MSPSFTHKLMAKLFMKRMKNVQFVISNFQFFKPEIQKLFSKRTK